MNFTIDERRSALESLIQSLRSMAVMHETERQVVSDALLELSDEEELEERRRASDDMQKEADWINIKLDKANIRLSNLS